MTTPRTFTPTRWREDDHRYRGYRFVTEVDANGKQTTCQRELTPEEILYPQAGDFIVRNMAHNEDALYLWHCFKSNLAPQLNRRAFYYQRTDFGVAGIKPLCVDVIVFDGTSKWNGKGETFVAAEIGATPLLVIEVTSPVTRDNDIGIKFDLYRRCRVPLYVIVDRQVNADNWRCTDVSLWAYRLGPDGFNEVESDKVGRIWLDPVNLWLGLDKNKVVCFDESGYQLPTVLELFQYANNGRRDLEKTQCAPEMKRCQIEQQMPHRNNP